MPGCPRDRSCLVWSPSPLNSNSAILLFRYVRNRGPILTCRGPGRDDGSPSGHKYQNVHIGGGSSHLGDTYYLSGSALSGTLGIDNPLNLLPYAEDAPFNQYSKQHESACLLNTCVDLLHEIYYWTNGQD